MPAATTAAAACLGLLLVALAARSSAGPTQLAALAAGATAGPMQLAGPAARAAAAPAQAAQQPAPAALRRQAAAPPSSPSLPLWPVPQRLVVKVRSVWPHDPEAFTQGLVWNKGILYESTGIYGKSSLREVDPRSGEVRRRLEVPPGFFAEGLAQVGNRLVQLTWKEGVAFVYDVRSFERTGELHYEGEGWGLCYDGHRLVMSDGSDRLSFREPKTLALLGAVNVRREGRPQRALNELECVDGAVYANVWMTDDIVRIDPASGQVTAVIDARGLLAADELDRADVLNGIAYDAARKTFLITGKRWPKMFEVTFVPAPP